MIARPARERDVGVLFEIRDEVSASSDCSSASRRESCVVANEGMDIWDGSLGGIFVMGGFDGWVW